MIKTPQILIIDDDQKMREVLRQKLEDAGYKILEASNGDVGVGLYRKEMPELVITNLLMSGKDGIDVLIELKLNFPKVKIIVVSGSTKYYAMEKLAFDLGAASSFSKDCDWNNFLATVDGLLCSGE